jgi:hypothetical protein
MNLLFFCLSSFTILVFSQTSIEEVFANPTTPAFIYTLFSEPKNIYATEAGGSPVTTIPTISTIDALFYNQRANSERLAFLDLNDGLFYSYNLITNVFERISATPFYFEPSMQGYTYTTRAPDGSNYGKFYTFLFYILVNDYANGYLYEIQNLVSPSLTSIFRYDTVINIQAIAVNRNGELYAGTNGLVYQLDWSTGELLNIITGYPTDFPLNIIPSPQTWFVFDNSGTVLYMPCLNTDDGASYVIACDLRRREFRISNPAPSSFYDNSWYGVRYIAYYGKQKKTNFLF